MNYVPETIRAKLWNEGTNSYHYFVWCDKCKQLVRAEDHWGKVEPAHLMWHALKEAP